MISWAILKLEACWVQSVTFTLHIQKLFTPIVYNGASLVITEMYAQLRGLEFWQLGESKGFCIRAGCQCLAEQ